jgi:hypothetical protein
MIVGSVDQFRDREAVVRATTALRRDINMASVHGKEKPFTLAIDRSLFQRELAPMENALHQAGLSRLPAEVDRSALGRFKLTCVRGRNRGLAAVPTVGPFHLRKDPQRNERAL